MSVHTWGESPHGQWLLEIHNEGRYMGKLIVFFYTIKAFIVYFFNTISFTNNNKTTNHFHEKKTKQKNFTHKKQKKIEIALFENLYLSDNNKTKKKQIFN